MTADLTDPADPAVLDALTRTCHICHAQPNFPCTNPCGDQPLPGRLIHHERRGEQT